MNKNSPQPIRIFLEKGATLEGRGWGDFSKPRHGEFVFCTAMSGIEESLTDPSFARQILVTTVSHVGNTGYNGEDMEAQKIWAEGLVCRHVESTPSNWRSRTSLPEWIVKEGRFVVDGVDTRELTVILREQGSQRGIVVSADAGFDVAKAQKYIQSEVPPMEGLDLTTGVSCSSGYDVNAGGWGFWPLGTEFKCGDDEAGKPNIAVWDFGVKKNTLRTLCALGANVRVMPASSTAEDLLAAGTDGILLSNGPGDPAAATNIIRELKKVIGQRPIFAICLGHQLVACAAGAKTYKMKFGHRGIHHPVLQLDESGRPLRTWITSQNHGFAVDAQNLPKGIRVSFVHGDDETVEGLSLPEYSCETVQFHPEAAPGPTDSSILLRNFVSGLRQNPSSSGTGKKGKSSIEVGTR